MRDDERRRFFSRFLSRTHHVSNERLPEDAPSPPAPSLSSSFPSPRTNAARLTSPRRLSPCFRTGACPASPTPAAASSSSSAAPRRSAARAPLGLERGRAAPRAAPAPRGAPPRARARSPRRRESPPRSPRTPRRTPRAAKAHLPRFTASSAARTRDRGDPRPVDEASFSSERSAVRFSAASAAPCRRARAARGPGAHRESARRRVRRDRAAASARRSAERHRGREASAFVRSRVRVRVRVRVWVLRDARVVVRRRSARGPRRLGFVVRAPRPPPPPPRTPPPRRPPTASRRRRLLPRRRARRRFPVRGAPRAPGSRSQEHALGEPSFPPPDQLAAHGREVCRVPRGVLRVAERLPPRRLAARTFPLDPRVGLREREPPRRPRRRSSRIGPGRSRSRAGCEARRRRPERRFFVRRLRARARSRRRVVRAVARRRRGRGPRG